MQKLNETMQRAVNGGAVRYVEKWQAYAGQKYYLTNPTGWMYLQRYDSNTGLYLYAGYLDY